MAERGRPGQWGPEPLRPQDSGVWRAHPGSNGDLAGEAGFRRGEEVTLRGTRVRHVGCHEEGDPRSRHLLDQLSLVSAYCVHDRS